MKHNLKVTLILLAFYLSTQLLGLALIGKELTVTREDGRIIVEHPETALGPRPELSAKGAFIYIAAGIILGTAAVLLIMRAGKLNLWKLWFTLAAFIAMAISLGALVEKRAALLLAAILAWLKVERPNPVLHNLTEVLMYSGIALFLAPLLDLFWASAMLLAVSAYDAYAVWKSKHMVKMAKFQSESKVFAGFNVPYLPSGELVTKTPRKGGRQIVARTALLGGGDVAFPLIFSGAFLDYLIGLGVPKAAALVQASFISLASAAALAALFFLGKQDRFYPAMPFITIGCFAGLLLALL